MITESTECKLDASEVGIQHTLEFVNAHATPGCRILDAGCGTGRLALRLSESGYLVTAIDESDSAVEACRKIGVPAEEIDFLQFESEEPFDVILFSKSFHHVHPLADAITKVLSLLKPDGLLLLEDFAAEALDEPTGAWFYGLKSVLAANNAKDACGPKLEEGKIPSDPVASWKEHHFSKHSVTPYEEIREALWSKFRLVDEQQVPYLYRYFLDEVSEVQARAIMEWETLLCKQKQIRTIGIRVAAEPFTFA
jgi:SAM-dependent methyltransferase